MGKFDMKGTAYYTLSSAAGVMFFLSQEQVTASTLMPEVFVHKYT